jgi:hypothetical protein
VEMRGHGVAGIVETQGVRILSFGSRVQHFGSRV